MLEEIFQLVKHCGIRYEEAWDMPVPYRKWWIERTNKEHEKDRRPESPGKSGPPPWAGKGKR